MGLRDVQDSFKDHFLLFLRAFFLFFAIKIRIKENQNNNH